MKRLKFLLQYRMRRYARPADAPFFALRNRRGVTMVEMIVVIAITMIFLGAVTLSVVTWSHWSAKRSNNAHAEELYYAVQAALSHQSASGEYTELQRELDALFEIEAGSRTPFLYETPRSILPTRQDAAGANTGEAVDVDGSNKLKKIYSLLNGEPYGAEGGASALLSELTEKYVLDRTVFEHRICVELLPNSGTVYAVWYLDSNVSYEDFRAQMTVENRDNADLSCRIGYFGPKTGDKVEDYGVVNKVAISTLSIVNEEELYLSFHLGERYRAMTPALDYKVDLYRVNGREITHALIDGSAVRAGEAALYMTIRVPAGSLLAYDESETPLSNRSELQVDFYDGAGAVSRTASYPVRLYFDESYEVRIVLDAIDQGNALSGIPTEQTLSGVRFFDMPMNLTAVVKASGNMTRDSHTHACDEKNVENSMFSAYGVEGGRVQALIRNIRHFYNVRYHEMAIPAGTVKVDYLQISRSILDWSALVAERHVYDGGKAVSGLDAGAAFLPLDRLSAISTYTTHTAGNTATLRGFTIYAGGDTEARALILRNEGTFDSILLSASHTRTDLSSSALLAVLNEGVISNCTVSTIGTFDGKNKIGIVVSENLGRIENTTAAGSIHGNVYVGGISAYDAGSNGPDGEKYIRNRNLASVAGEAAVGGIIGGTAEDGESFVIRECANFGAISALRESDLFIGGIVGLNCLAEISASTGTPRMDEKAPLYGYFVGGIVGLNIHKGMISDCNTGDTDENGRPLAQRGLILGKQFVGGICGFNATAMTDGRKTDNINNENNVDVLGVCYVGGVVGANTTINMTPVMTYFRALEAGNVTSPLAVPVPEKTYHDDITIRHWVNRGVVLGRSDTDGESSRYIGGITGWNSGNVIDSFSNIAVHSDVFKEGGEMHYAGLRGANGDYVGGVVGYNCGYLAGATVSETDYTYDGKTELGVNVLVVGQNYVGGIVGYNERVPDEYGADHSASGLILGYALKSGYIDAKHFVGGFIGFNANGDLYEHTYRKNGEEQQIHLCAAPSAITGEFFVGGVIGASVTEHEHASIKIYGELSNPIGHVTGLYYVGGLIGYLSEASTTGSLLADNQKIDAYREKLLALASAEHVGLTKEESQKKNALAIFRENFSEHQDSATVVTLTAPMAGSENGKSTMGEVRGKLLAAGILGFADPSTRIVIENITNNSAVTTDETITHAELTEALAVSIGYTAAGSSEIHFVTNEKSSDVLYSLTGGIIGFVYPNTVVRHCENTDIALVTTDGTYTASIAEVSLGTISSCTSGIIVGNNDVGGIVGVNANGALVENCALSGTIYGDSDLGGIVAHNYGIIRDCVVDDSGAGNIAIQSSGSFVGGVVANMFAGTIDNCTVRSSIEGNAVFVGGLIGNYQGGEIRTFHIDGVIRISGSRCVGGLIGMTHQDLSGAMTQNSGGTVLAYDGEAAGIVGATSSPTVEIKNCHNTFHVTANMGDVGGILPVNGRYYVQNASTDEWEARDTGTFTISHCTNSGDVSVGYYDSVGGNYAGGIVGRNLIGNTIRNCVVGLTFEPDGSYALHTNMAYLISEAGEVATYRDISTDLRDGAQAYTAAAVFTPTDEVVRSGDTIYEDDGVVTISGIEYAGGITAINEGDIRTSVVEASVFVELREPNISGQGYLGGAVGANGQNATLYAVQVGDVKGGNDQNNRVKVYYTYPDNSTIYLGGVAGVNLGCVAGHILADDENVTLAGNTSTVFADLKWDGTSNATIRGAIGGVVGLNLNVLSYYDVVADIEGEFTMVGHGNGIGGVAGINGSDTFLATIARSTFSGTIECLGSASDLYRVGGIAGINSEYGLPTEEDSLVTYCALGTRQNTKITTTVGMIGGYIGYNGGRLISCRDNASAYTVEISDARGAGDISIGGAVGYLGTNGFVYDLQTGNANKKWTVKTSYSSANSETYGVSGMVGTSVSLHKIEEMTNYANVVSSVPSGKSANACYGTGGVVGLINITNYNAIYIGNATNYGEINGYKHSAGIVGYMPRCGGYFMNCNNLGTIRGGAGDSYNSVGAILGNKWDDGVTYFLYFSNCKTSNTVYVNNGATKRLNGRLNMSYSTIAPVIQGCDGASNGDQSGNYQTQFGTTPNGIAQPYVTPARYGDAMELFWPARTAPTYYTLRVYEILAGGGEELYAEYTLNGSMKSAMFRLNPLWDLSKTSYRVELFANGSTRVADVLCAVSTTQQLPTPDVRVYRQDGRYYLYLKNRGDYTEDMLGRMRVTVTWNGTTFNRVLPNNGNWFVSTNTFDFSADNTLAAQAFSTDTSQYSDSAISVTLFRRGSHNDTLGISGDATVTGSTFDTLQANVILSATTTGNWERTTGRVELIGVTETGDVVINAVEVLLPAGGVGVPVSIPFNTNMTREQFDRMRFTGFKLRYYEWASGPYIYYYEFDSAPPNMGNQVTYDPVFTENGTLDPSLTHYYYAHQRTRYGEVVLNVNFMPAPSAESMQISGQNGDAYEFRWGSSTGVEYLITVYGSNETDAATTSWSMLSSEVVRATGTSTTYRLDSSRYNYAQVRFTVVSQTDGTRVENSEDSHPQRLALILETPARPSIRLESKESLFYNVSWTSLVNDAGLGGYRLKLVAEDGTVFYFPSETGILSGRSARIDLSAVANHLETAGASSRQVGLYLIAVSSSADYLDATSNPLNFVIPNRLGTPEIGTESGTDPHYVEVDLSYLEGTNPDAVTVDQFNTEGFFEIRLQGNLHENGSYHVEYILSDTEPADFSTATSVTVATQEGLLYGVATFRLTGLSASDAGRLVWVRLCTRSSSKITSGYSGVISLTLPGIALDAPVIVPGEYENDEVSIVIGDDESNPALHPATQVALEYDLIDGASGYRVVLTQCGVGGNVIGDVTLDILLGNEGAGRESIFISVSGETITVPVTDLEVPREADGTFGLVPLYSRELSYTHTNGVLYRVKATAYLGINTDEKGMITSFTLILPDIVNFLYFSPVAAAHDTVTAKLTTRVTVQALSEHHASISPSAKTPWENPKETHS